jgi:hypothetical protein
VEQRRRATKKSVATLTKLAISFFLCLKENYYAGIDIRC